MHLTRVKGSYMRCPNCENENREGAKYCDECGFPLTGAIARAASELGVDERADREEPESGQPVADESNGDEVQDVEGQVVNDATIEIAVDESTPADEDVVDSEEEQSGEDEVADAADEAVATEADDVELPPVSAYEGDISLDEQKTAAIGVDLSGFDRSYDYGERLVDPGYKEPTVNWRDGGTMKMQPVEEEPQRGRDFLESSQVQKSNRSKIIVGVIAAVIAVAAIVAFATYQMQLWGGVALPNVIGMTEADAQSVLEEHGFTVKSMQVKSDDTEGLVLVMDPDASSRAEEGSEVIIHIASARIVPSIVGESQEKAAAAFKDEGFENIVYEKQSSDEPAGTVLSVTPEPGTRAKSAQEIIVKVAEPYTVPEVAGLYLDDAIAAIEKAGLAYDIAYVNTVDYPDGQIIGSQPAASEQVKSDTVVVIQIARARGVELENLTRSYLAPGNTVSIGIYNYAVESLDAVEYLGSETVAYTMTARPFTYILGETVSISARQVSGQVIFNEDNTIASIS